MLHFNLLISARIAYHESASTTGLCTRVQNAVSVGVPPKCPPIYDAKLRTKLVGISWTPTDKGS